MSSSSEFGLTEEQIVYELASVLHSYILDILGYGIYTSIYFVAVYLICTSSLLTQFQSLQCMFSVSENREAPYRLSRPRHHHVDPCHDPCEPPLGHTWQHIHSTWRNSESATRVEFIFPIRGILSTICSRSSSNIYQSATSRHNYGKYIHPFQLFMSTVLRLPQIWRCWVLYGQRWLVIMIPGISLVIGTGAQQSRIYLVIWDPSSLLCLAIYPLIYASWWSGEWSNHKPGARISIYNCSYKHILH